MPICSDGCCVGCLRRRLRVAGAGRTWPSGARRMPSHRRRYDRVRPPARAHSQHRHARAGCPCALSSRGGLGRARAAIHCPAPADGQRRDPRRRKTAARSQRPHTCMGVGRLEGFRGRADRSRPGAPLGWPTAAVVSSINDCCKMKNQCLTRFSWQNRYKFNLPQKTKRYIKSLWELRKINRKTVVRPAKSGNPTKTNAP
jgi:hypothetical protein